MIKDPELDQSAYDTVHILSFAYRSLTFADLFGFDDVSYPYATCVPTVKRSRCISAVVLSRQWIQHAATAVEELQLTSR